LAPYERHLAALHKHEIEDAAYETPLDAGSVHGVGIRSQIYWCWFQKIEFQALLVEYMERAALGFEIWYYPEGNEEAVVNLQTAARNRVGRRNFLLFPMPLGQAESPYRVEVIEPNMAGAESLRSLLEGYFGHQIKRFILGQILTSEAEATGLGSGVADLHYQTLLDIIKYDATNLEETITRDLLCPLGRLNDRDFDDVDMRFVIQTHSPDVMERLDAYQKAWQMGARLREADVLEAIGAAVPTAEDAVLQNQQAAPPPPPQGATAMPGAEGATTESNATLPPDNFQQAFASPEARQDDLRSEVAESLGGEWRPDNEATVQRMGSLGRRFRYAMRRRTSLPCLRGGFESATV
ncbi:MAG: phage portal protein family protein, partial [Candidatus Dormibacteria bacterium]